jgi:hypothetical protein
MSLKMILNVLMAKTKATSKKLSRDKEVLLENTDLNLKQIGLKEAMDKFDHHNCGNKSGKSIQQFKHLTNPVVDKNKQVKGHSFEAIAGAVGVTIVVIALIATMNIPALEAAVVFL